MWTRLGRGGGGVGLGAARVAPGRRATNKDSKYVCFLPLIKHDDPLVILTLGSTG